jgi:predicted DNA-binding ribbon-helix-helix protein
MPGKRVQLDEESWSALDLLARDRMMTFQELADEAFADVLKKHGRPVDLRAALRKSAQAADALQQGGGKRRKGKSGAKASRA